MLKQFQGRGIEPHVGRQHSLAASISILNVVIFSFFFAEGSRVVFCFDFPVREKVLGRFGVKMPFKFQGPFKFCTRSRLDPQSWVGR